MGSRLSLYARISLSRYVMANTLSLPLPPPRPPYSTAFTFTSTTADVYEPPADVRATCCSLPASIPRLHRLRNVISNVTLLPLLPSLDHLTSVSMLLSFRDPQPKLILVAVDEREGISEERKIGRKIYTYIYMHTYICVEIRWRNRFCISST